MKIRHAELKTVCGFTSTLPESDLPEIAFAGRSNVGKSSLINALMQRKRLARVGETPGKTRTINFYEVDALAEKSRGKKEDSGVKEAPAPPEEALTFRLVDLPGYGYAHVSLDEKARWGKMIERYLAAERDLRAVFLLLDIRHEPNANDRQMYEWIRKSGHTPVLIATKADKIKRSKVSAQLKLIRAGLNAEKGSAVYTFSAQTQTGREQICACIAGLVQDSSQTAGVAQDSSQTAGLVQD